MKNSILKLGNALNKAEQKNVNGGDLQILCTYCGYLTPNMRTCIRNGFVYTEACIPE